LQQVITIILEAYYEPKFSTHSHGFRPERGCHTALKHIVKVGSGTKWFIEADLCQCFDKIDHSVLLDILKESFHDNRFIRLITSLLKAGYLENWKFNKTYSGVPQGSIAGPIFSNIVLDRLDKYVEEHLIPMHTKGQKRKAYLPYRKKHYQILMARKRGDWELVHELTKELRAMPSSDPKDPRFRRLWYVRYADDFLLGLIGTKEEAEIIKEEIANFLNKELKLSLNFAKTLVTHAGGERAKFLGYEIHVLRNDTKCDKDGIRRSINGNIGLQVTRSVIKEKCAQYKRHGKPVHLPLRTMDEAFSTIAQYQAEYRGIVQYYRMAYNLHSLIELKFIMQQSLVKTLAAKYKTTCTRIYKRFGAKIKTKEGEYKVLMVKIESQNRIKPLTSYFGGISLKWNKWGSIKEASEPIFNNRTELIQRLLAQECELCRSQDRIEAHHIRKLADLKRKDGATQSKWKVRMAERGRKTLIVCRKCHTDIHQGRYDQNSMSV
jgi:group II intron reverse transcriptase/maturase